MNSTQKRKILIVDHDPISLKILEIELSREQLYEIHRARDGKEGMRVAREIKPDAIISDYHMPGVSGLQFCQCIRNDPELSTTIFILLSSESDVIKKNASLEQGADDYIEKAISPSVLLSKVKAFLRIKNLQDELMEEREKFKAANQLLEVNFKELIAVLLKILEIQIPGARDRALFAKKAAEYITLNMAIGQDETKKIVFSSIMHEMGKTGLPQNLVKKNYQDLSTAEQEVFHQHPLVGSVIISNISGYKESAEDVYHQYENFDGSGLPDHLRGTEITIGARILRAINLEEELFKAGSSSDDVVEQVRLAAGKHLDPSVAAYLAAFLIENKDSLSQDKEKISVDELRTGMVVAEDIYSSNGTKIIPRNAQIKDWMLNIILERNAVDPIIGGVYIFRKK